MGCTAMHGARARKPRGFTLIELLVVVAIIALLIAILLPSLANARRTAQRTTCAANLSAVGKAIMVYNGEFGIMPRCIRALFTTTKEPAAMDQWLRTEGTWNLNGAEGPVLPLARYIGGGAHSRSLVCPGTGIQNPFDMGSPNWFDALDGQKWPEVQTLNKKNNFVYGAYSFFMGDPGNLKKDNYYTDAGMTTYYSGLDGQSARAADLNPSSLLAQDLLRVEATSNLPQGNHPKRGALLKNSFESTSSLYAGGKIYNSGFYVGNVIQDFDGANVLLADGSVSFMKVPDLTVVYTKDNANGGALGYTRYLGSPKY